MKQIILIILISLFCPNGMMPQQKINIKDPAIVYGKIDTDYFAVSQRPVTNREYIIYLEWVINTLGVLYPETYLTAIPGVNIQALSALNEYSDRYILDTIIKYSDPILKVYVFNPKYLDYPVLGVSWKNANDYCKWFTDRYNETKLIKIGNWRFQEQPTEQDYFNTERYLLKALQGSPIKEKYYTYENRILLAAFRLPTSAEREAVKSDPLLSDVIKEYPFTKDNVLYKWNSLYISSVTDTSYQLKNYPDKYKARILAKSSSLKKEKTSELLLDINNKNGTYNLIEIYKQNGQQKWERPDSTARDLFYGKAERGEFNPLIMIDDSHNQKMMLVDGYTEPEIQPVKPGFYSVFRIACSVKK